MSTLRPFGYTPRGPWRAFGLEIGFHFGEISCDGLQFGQRLAELLLCYGIRIAVITGHGRLAVPMAADDRVDACVKGHRNDFRTAGNGAVTTELYFQILHACIQRT